MIERAVKAMQRPIFLAIALASVAAGLAVLAILLVLLHA